MSAQKSDNTLKKLLDGLAKKQDSQVAFITLSGRALSRSAKNIHVAVSSGIVAVPIANIQKVVSVPGSQPGIVRLVVNNPHQIQSLLGVRPANPGDGSNPTADKAEDGEIVQGDLLVKGVWGVGVSTCDLYSSDTVTGGEGNADTCDDTETDDCHADDEE
jgi:hypothetical protein